MTGDVVVPQEQLCDWARRLREGADAEGGGPCAMEADRVASELELRAHGPSEVAGG